MIYPSLTANSTRIENYTLINNFEDFTHNKRRFKSSKEWQNFVKANRAWRDDHTNPNMEIACRTHRAHVFNLKIDESKNEIAQYPSQAAKRRTKRKAVKSASENNLSINNPDLLSNSNLPNILKHQKPIA